MTEGFGLLNYLPGRRVLNRGIGGDAMGDALPADDPRGVLRRLHSSVFDCAATDVFLLIGINDLGDRHSPETIEQGYRDLLRQIKARTPLVRVWVESVLPTSRGYAKHNSSVLEVNRRLEKLAAEFKYSYLNLNKLLAYQRGEQRADCTRDGLHLPEPGYRIWRQAVLKALGWEAVE